MIQRFELLPVTEESHPFMSAADKCDFAANAYREDEYLLHGTANVYERTPKGIGIAFAQAPYVNRCMVRYPAKPETASGNVVIEILNATTHMDLDRMWILGKDFHMRNGDVYVPVSSKPVTMYAMKKFDPARYASLSWKNPRVPRFPSSMMGNAGGTGGADSAAASENGLFWDMLTDLADAMRTGNVNLGGIKVRRVYLAGWSQSGAYSIRYINELIPLYNKKRSVPVFDGYLLGGPPRTCIPGLNQEESCASLDAWKDCSIGKTEQPCIVVQTESENAWLGGFQAIEPDTDAEERKFRRYEIPGSTHDADYNMRDYYKGSDEQRRVGIALKNPGLTNDSNNYPYELVFHKAWDFLYKWVENGEAPPKLPRIAVGPDHLTNAKDENGNALGGWRLPTIDAPVCVWNPISKPLRADWAGDCALYGCKEYFPLEKLQKMYGSLKEYAALVAEKTDELIAKGLLLPEDRETLLRRTVEIAVQAGLT